MNIEVEPGKYVVAVSGGVDSVTLLDLLAQKPELKLIVAHFDHGIRPDSKSDRLHVKELAKKYNLSFVYDEGKLGAGASEEKAREARYKFLHKTRESANARAIITAHHQDDLLETAIINLLRGTGRKGLSSLTSSDKILRPLLHLSKPDLFKHAKRHGLTWREDPTNKDQYYLRNYVRHQIVPKLNKNSKQKLIDIVTKSKRLNEQIDEQLISQLHLQPSLKELDRDYFVTLPHEISMEVMNHWLKKNGAKNLNRKLLEQIVAAAKTLKAGKLIDVDLTHVIKISPGRLTLKNRD